MALDSLATSNEKERLHEVATQFVRQAPAVAAWSLRMVDETYQGLSVRQDILQPVRSARSTGAMVTVADQGGLGYAATSDLSPSGLREAVRQAAVWARASARFNLLDSDTLPWSTHQGHYHTPTTTPWDAWPVEDKIALLHRASHDLKIHDCIVDWEASLAYKESCTLLVTSEGGHIEQDFVYLNPRLVAFANKGSETQRRTHGNGDAACQGGLEQLQRLSFPTTAPRVAEEALRLLDAPECPAGCLELLLLPAQAILQIHESIGHPLELDRILGDERNYAGTSFVNLDMFGSYRYGSELLNVTFDPTRPEQLASYAYDDEGEPAQRQFLIRKGILERPLGGTLSQARAGMPGVANSRACSWNRPPIDRMANLNLEAGTSSLEALIGGIERGVLMDTNRSWSIDDSRNKFQFGCEYGRLIQDGALHGIVKNPNYRGISATFWRSLSGVGDPSTLRVLGTPNCGKGEPNQSIYVGHVAPACAFRDVEVFGSA